MLGETANPATESIEKTPCPKAASVPASPRAAQQNLPAISRRGGFYDPFFFGFPPCEIRSPSL